VQDYIKLIIWVVVVGGVFAYLWRKGHLARARKYVSETQDELKKCTWPSTEELKGSTVVVLVATILIGFFVVVVDLIYQLLFTAIT
jgi:preprotein translocase subunit SecE